MVVESLGPAESLSDFMEKAFLAEVTKRRGPAAAEPTNEGKAAAGPRLPGGRRPKP